MTTVWTSLDLLVYIHTVVFPKYPFAQTDSDLRKVNARMGGVQAEATQRLQKYRRYISDSNTLLRVLPQPKIRSLL